LWSSRNYHYTPVVEVPMADGESREEAVTPEEEESDEKAESGHSDDEEDVDYMNHETLSKEAVRANTPTQRVQRVDIWRNVRNIANHDVPDRGMNAECTYVCVYRLDNSLR
jgi:hypothetical protein